MLEDEIEKANVMSLSQHAYKNGQLVRHVNSTSYVLKLLSCYLLLKCKMVIYYKVIIYNMCEYFKLRFKYIL